MVSDSWFSTKNSFLSGIILVRKNMHIYKKSENEVLFPWLIYKFRKTYLKSGLCETILDL